MKLRDPEVLLKTLGIELKDGAGRYRGRNVRYLDAAGLFQIGSDDFDRWANSVELEFDLWLARGQRQFLRWIENSC